MHRLHSRRTGDTYAQVAPSARDFQKENLTLDGGATQEASEEATSVAILAIKTEVGTASS